MLLERQVAMTWMGEEVAAYWEALSSRWESLRVVGKEDRLPFARSSTGRSEIDQRNGGNSVGSHSYAHTSTSKTTKRAHEAILALFSYLSQAEARSITSLGGGR